LVYKEKKRLIQISDFTLLIEVVYLNGIRVIFTKKAGLFFKQFPAFNPVV